MNRKNKRGNRFPLWLDLIAFFFWVVSFILTEVLTFECTQILFLRKLNNRQKFRSSVIQFFRFRLEKSVNEAADIYIYLYFNCNVSKTPKLNQINHFYYIQFYINKLKVFLLVNKANESFE